MIVEAAKAINPLRQVDKESRKLRQSMTRTQRAMQLDCPVVRGIDANDLRTLSWLVAKERRDMDWEFVDVEDGLRKAGLKSLFPDRARVLHLACPAACLAVCSASGLAATQRSKGTGHAAEEAAQRS